MLTRAVDFGVLAIHPLVRFKPVQEDPGRWRIPDLVGDPSLKSEALMSFGAMCALEPERAIRLLRTLADSVPYEPGPSAAERPQLIAKLEAELAALETDDEALTTPPSPLASRSTPSRRC